jgi:hypothetical protein
MLPNHCPKSLKGLLFWSVSMGSPQSLVSYLWNQHPLLATKSQPDVMQPTQCCPFQGLPHCVTLSVTTLLLASPKATAAKPAPRNTVTMAHPLPVTVHLAQTAFSQTMGVTPSPIALELVPQMAQPHNSCNMHPSLMNMLSMLSVSTNLSCALRTTTTTCSSPPSVTKAMM